jgi:hypothetical protein
MLNGHLTVDKKCYFYCLQCLFVLIMGLNVKVVVHVAIDLMVINHVLNFHLEATKLNFLHRLLDDK